MIQLANEIWIGDSSVSCKELRSAKIRAVLNVAQDLRGDVGWPDVEYMQVGLIDGPGNPLSAYYAAVLALASLVARHRTLVCCHTSSRSMVVAAMYLNIHAELDWDGLMVMLGERVDVDLPVPHEAHRVAFNQMDWRLLAGMVK